MASRIIQLCPIPLNIRYGWLNENVLKLYQPLCIALVEKGTQQDIVYMETVDNEVKPVDIKNPDFIGVASVDDIDKLKELEIEAEKRFKGRNVKSKQ